MDINIKCRGITKKSRNQINVRKINLHAPDFNREVATLCGVWWYTEGTKFHFCDLVVSEISARMRERERVCV